jgi:hypothetical protein
MVDRDRCRPQAISRAGPSEEPGASAVSHRDRQPLEWWTIQRQPLPFLHAGASNPTTARGGVLCLAGPSVWWIRPPWDCCSVAPIADLHEQTFVAHAGQIAAGSANVGQLFRPGYPHPQGECDRAFSEGGLQTAGQPNSLCPVPITFTNLDGGLWRSFEGNRQHKVRSFGQPEAPTISVTYQIDAVLNERRLKRSF